MSTNSANVPEIRTSRLNLTQAILWSTLVAGALDATDGVIYFGLHGLNPIQVLQYIASGVLGAAAFQDGLAAAALGTALHFLIAGVVAAIYVLASRALPVLAHRPVPFGLVFGAAVYLVMTYLVLPLSAVSPSPFSVAALVNGLLGHALFVGLPIAFFASRIRR